MANFNDNNYKNTNKNHLKPSESSASLGSIPDSVLALNRSTASSNEQQNQTKQQFSSNLCAILNDPRKDRTKINYLFTKTWGSDFVDTAHVPSIKSIHSNFVNYKIADFKDYLNSSNDRISKHNKNKSDLLNVTKSDSNTSLSANQQQLNDLEQIPKIFFDPNFCLSNKETFNALISSKVFETKNKSNGVVGSYTNNPFLIDSTNRLDIQEAQSYKLILDKLSVYLDITEMHISKQISTKANTFFNAIHSQDEVQEHVLKTCTAVKNLRKKLKYLDENVILASIRVIKLVSLKLKLINLIEKFELMASVYQTQPTIQLHLSSSEFTGALDLIAMSQDILRQDLRGILSLRHYDSQFTEIEKAIDKLLHQEFSRYIISDLSRDFSAGSQISNQEKLCSLMLGILRIKLITFVDLFKEEIFIYLKSTVKQTIVEFVSQLDEDLVDGNEEDNNLKLIDRVRNLKIQEFLHLLSKVLANIKTMLGRIQSINKIIISVVNSAAGVKSSPDGSDNIGIFDAVLLTKELISKKTHSKLVSDLNNLVSNASDYAQERLVNLLEAKFKDNDMDKIDSNDFISISNLIEQFVIDFDIIANKKTASLRSWIQNQANKFLQKFHSVKKDKISLAFDSELWKQMEISNDLQSLIDHILANGLGVQHKKPDARIKKSSDYLMIKDERYVIFGTVVVVIKFMYEYSLLAIEIPTLCFDIMTRLIEIFKIFNSKLFQMILGGGAASLGSVRVITFKVLAITYRCLEFVLNFLPLVKEFFREKLTEKQTNIDKQFNNLIKDFNDHKIELNNKLVFMIDEIFREVFSNYEVIAPVPSQCFRTICNQITKVHGIVSEILNEPTLIQLFNEIHVKFKERLNERLRVLNVVNDGGPQHALLISDLSYYIKQFKGLNGLHVINFNFEDAWVK